MLTTFPFNKTFVVAIGLSRQIISYHLVIPEQKMFTSHFVPFSLRSRPFLFNIPKFIFSLSIKNKLLVRHLCLIKSLTSFHFLSNLSFLMTKLEIYTLVFSFFSDNPKLTISLAIFFWIIVSFMVISPVVKYYLSGEESSRQLLRWCFISFLVAPGKTVDFICLFNHQPSICFTIESPSMSIFSLWGILDLRSWLIFWFTLLLIRVN